MSNRAQLAAERLERVKRATEHDNFRQRLDDWLQVATRGEVARAPSWIRRSAPVYLGGALERPWDRA